MAVCWKTSSNASAPQVRAAVSVNRELVLLYWTIGSKILTAQAAQGWAPRLLTGLPPT